MWFDRENTGNLKIDLSGDPDNLKIVNEVRIFRLKFVTRVK